LEVPSTKKEIKFRPFLVKEEKILLIAMQEENVDVLFNAVNQIIDNCTFNQLNVSNLTTYDIEFIFLQIRIKSKGADISLSFNCGAELEDGKSCEHVTVVEYNLDQVSVDGTSKNNTKIILDEATKTGVILTIPTFENSKDAQEIMMKEGVAAIYKMLPIYIDTIFQGEEIFDDFTPAELEDWIENLNDDQFEKIKDFFEGVPRLQGDVNVICEGCGQKETVVLEGLQSFLE